MLLAARTATKRLNLLGLMRLDNHLTVYHSEKPLTGAFVVESLTHFVSQPHAKPVVIVLDNTTNVLSYTLTYTGIPTSSTVTMAHLHEITPPSSATAGVNGTGPPVIPFASLVSPIIGTTPTLTQARIDSMKNGFFYANIHTTAFPDGAIRGNIARQN